MNDGYTFGHVARMEWIRLRSLPAVKWTLLGGMAATLAIGFLAIRNGLKPVEEVSRMAAAIGPDAITLRLPAKDLPALRDQRRRRTRAVDREGNHAHAWGPRQCRRQSGRRRYLPPGFFRGTDHFMGSRPEA